jgi:hypothetical protein
LAFFEAFLVPRDDIKAHSKQFVELFHRYAHMALLADEEGRLTIIMYMPDQGQGLKRYELPIPRIARALIMPVRFQIGQKGLTQKTRPQRAQPTPRDRINPENDYAYWPARYCCQPPR